MAAVVSVQARPDGKYLVTYNDNTTAVLSAAEAKAQGVNVTGTGLVTNQPNPSGQTAYSSSSTAGAFSPGTSLPEGTVIVNGEQMLVSEALRRANNVNNLSVIRKNLLAFGQLTKAEARDPNNLLAKWAQILTGASNETGALKDPFKYAQTLQQKGFGSTTGVAEPYNQLVIYDPTKAKSFVTDKIKQLLNREPTQQEIDDYSAKLIAEQKKASSAAKTTYKTIDGVRTGIQTTGLDENQFLTDLITGTPEYKATKERLSSAVAQQIQAAAAANGIKLTPNQLSDWTNKVAGGESIETYKSILRDQAALGMPDQVKKLLGQGVDLESIYSPYRQTMSKVLEINPETITLDDPVLRSAISPSGELSLYDFQKALRKDPRWQYTNNAKEEVASSVAKVLQDFGFRG